MFFKPEYILILFATIIIDYFAGIWIEKQTTKEKKWQYLLLSLIINIGILAIFKYYNFFNENIEGLANLLGYDNPIPYLNIILPVGLSFHTFQAMSYTIEVYHGNQKAEKHFGIYALYVMFYPQLVAGPIERPQNMLWQYHKKHNFDYARVVSGLQEMGWGFFKKIVVADRLSIYVNEVFNNMDSYSGFPLVWGTLFFSFQMYCDFSGYTNIALGSARVMGINLMENFRRPFLATNLSDYWRRWHISLYSWFNDYLYNPIVIKFRQLGVKSVIAGILIVFTLSGLWHGAAWTFVLWGAMHGIGLCVELLMKKPLKKVKKRTPKLLYQNISRLITLTFLFFTFMLFRAENMHDVFYFFDNFLKLDSYIIGVPIFTKSYFIINLILIVFIIFSDLISEKEYLKKLPFESKINYSYLFFTFVALSILFLGIFEEQSFLYFQF